MRNPTVSADAVQGEGCEAVQGLPEVQTAHGRARSQRSAIGRAIAVAVGGCQSRLPSLASSPSLAFQGAHRSAFLPSPGEGDAPHRSPVPCHPAQPSEGRGVAAGGGGGTPTYPSPYPARRGGDPTNIDRVPPLSISTSCIGSPPLSTSRIALPPFALDTPLRYVPQSVYVVPGVPHADAYRAVGTRYPLTAYEKWKSVSPRSVAATYPVSEYPMFEGYQDGSWWLPPLWLLERYRLEPRYLEEKSEAWRRRMFERAMLAARWCEPPRADPVKIDTRLRRMLGGYRTFVKYVAYLETQSVVPLGTRFVARKILLEVCGMSYGVRPLTHAEPRGERPMQRKVVVPHTARPVFDATDA